MFLFEFFVFEVFNLVLNRVCEIVIIELLLELYYLYVLVVEEGL